MTTSPTPDRAPATGRGSTHERLIRLLDAAEVDYRVLAHSAEGRTDVASTLRGHDLPAAAKSMMLTLRHRGEGGGQATDAHVLAVVGGDRRVDYRKVRRLFQARDVTLAPPGTAERLSRCRAGCLIPFSLDRRFGVVLDPGLLSCRKVYFNAARLDVSVALGPDDLVELSGALVHTIAR